MKKIISISMFILSFLAKGYAQCGPIFSDGFESGSYTPTWSMGSGLTSGAVTTTSPAAGLYRLEGTGGTATHLTGFSTTIAASTPTQVSWWIYPTGSGASNYVVLGDASVSATNCISFCYWQGGTNIRFVSSSTAIYNCTPNQWYHIEMRNINFTTHVFDIYINNTLVQANFPFRNNSQNTLSKIHLYNFNSAVGVWDDIIIGNAAPLTLSNTSTNVLCNGGANGSIDLTATSINPGTLTYAWSNLANTQDISGLTAGNYSVIVTDGLGCQDSINNITITQPPALVTSINSVPLICNGNTNGTASISASGGTPGYTYLWSNGQTTTNASNLSGTEYFCTVTDTNGCAHVDSVTISEPLPLLATFNVVTPSCMGDNNGTATITSAGGTPGYTYSWSTMATTASIVNLSTGWYYCTTVDTQNCSHVDSVFVAEPAALNISLAATNPTSCGGNQGSINATITGGTAGYSYQWSNLAIIEDITGLTQGTYQLVVTDNHGCVDSSAAILSDPTPTNVSLNIPQDTVCMSSGSFNLTGASMGGGIYTGAGVSGGMFNPASAGVGSQTITYNYTDANSCTSSAQDVITVIACLGFENQNLDALIHIYPNPTVSEVNINMGMDVKETRLSILNEMGQVLENMLMTQQNSILNVEKYPSGIYYIQINTGEKVWVKKLVIQ